MSIVQVLLADGSVCQGIAIVDANGNQVFSLGGGAVDSVGDPIDPASWPNAYAYNADGTLNYQTITNNGDSWRQTYTYSSGLVATRSAWVKQ